MYRNPILFVKFTYILAFCLYGIGALQAQKENYTVAIFLYQGVELLDFAGPTEVFAATPGFDVFTVSVDGKEILSQGLVTVKPEYSIDNAPAPDIIVFPGGSSGASAKNGKVLAWARHTHATGNVVMSVCTGAFILAGAGLLDELEITTHYGSLASLGELLPKATVLEKTRYVDNDRIITTAGVSAGIDGALHLVARIKGIDVARRTAHYMEYDKWIPNEGKLATLNPVLQPNTVEDRETNSAINHKLKEGHIPFEGELIEFVTALNVRGKFQPAASWTERGVTWYPNSSKLFQQLRIAYAQLMKPVPMDEAAFLKLIHGGHIEEAILQYDRTMDEYPNWKIFDEAAMNDQGYVFLQQNHIETAIQVFQLNTRAYPDSGNAWDSLAEAYMAAGKKREAIQYYTKSLQKNPHNQNAKNMLVKLETDQP